MQETYLWGIAAVIALLLVLFLVWRGTARKAPEKKRPEENRPSPSASVEAPARQAPPVAAGNAPDASPPVTAQPAARSPFLPAPDGARDNLRQIKGIGPKLARQLEELGVFHFRQIAGWTPEQLAEVDARLGKFSGRPARDQWQEQARLLAAGDIKTYEKQHGKLRSE